MDSGRRIDRELAAGLLFVVLFAAFRAAEHFLRTWSTPPAVKVLPPPIDVPSTVRGETLEDG